jgi:hypothetical protein
VAVLALAAAVVPTTPVAAAEPIDALGVALAGSASCEFGDVDVEYAARSVDRQAVQFTSDDGAVLDRFEAGAYQSDYIGVEHILTAVAAEPDTTSQEVPAAGTRLAVYVQIGAGAPSPASTAEFFILYRCAPQGNDDGGGNEVLETCVSDYGTYPRTAQEALDADAPPPGLAVPPGAVVTPRFTG